MILALTLTLPLTLTLTLALTFTAVSLAGALPELPGPLRQVARGLSASSPAGIVLPRGAARQPVPDRQAGRSGRPAGGPAGQLDEPALRR